MADEQYTMKIAAGENRQMTFQTNKDYQNDIHYIGIFADMAVSDMIKFITECSNQKLHWHKASHLVCAR